MRPPEEAIDAGSAGTRLNLLKVRACCAAAAAARAAAVHLRASAAARDLRAQQPIFSRAALGQGIVEDAPPPQRSIHTIARNRAFEDVGAAGPLSAFPTAAHFGGFKPGALHSLAVRLTNTSPAAALRAHVVPPESPYFRVDHRRCGGAILPGLSDVLVIEFCPTELRYYHDTVRVHSNVGGTNGGAVWGWG
ncbi:hypothetical protein Rsub_04788 [Raphidocelis subcapitata]|uniref:Uncharacterized protein n=1 Tax=Raphidocelis subcapitata TaxID=307507 RepID=A0A2V0NUV5_9CHLO|nr:hypothetical protein Rsub_04788 [Raphidocelis subcapitata]|eukprot:GBF91119.1 hypothetical protein Rsub_04788 [Raphidocelis subcapitata]